ncbi:MAG: hypothetical protein QNJ00_01300, partial [Woeseiaceae bacterium]|nr:hypothetical protein [Woeseiaceae bacterium]
MHALVSMRSLRKLALIVPVLALTGCGQGEGPVSIQNSPAEPLPVRPPGFCDPITFELGCDEPGLLSFGLGGAGTTIIDNPDPSGINTSDRVAEMRKRADQVFGGTRIDGPGGPIDFSEGEVYKIKIWSSREVPVTFKLEEEGNPEGGLERVVDHPGGSVWEELCFDFTGQMVPPPVFGLTIIFDNGVLGQVDTDPANWTFYYDDITQVRSCDDSGGPVGVQPDSALFSSSGDPDLVIPDDYAEMTPFGSGSVIDPMYADDPTFSPVLSVWSGTGYGANVAQIGFIGFPAGFLTDYETVDFKVKGVPNFVVFVKLFDGVDARRISLTSSATSTNIGDGWFQVSIPVAALSGVDQATGIVFESDDSAATQFRMLLDDIGFSGTGTRVPSAPGTIPEVKLFDRGGMPDLVIPDDYAEISVFGSAATLDGSFTGDIDFSPAWQVTTGFGYDIWNAQFAYTGFATGFADAYETLHFKVKDLSGDVIRVKLLPDPAYVDINVTSSPYATALGNGWYQVSVPINDIPGAAASDGLLFETISPAPAESFSYLLTDIGFSGSGFDPADPGLIPDDVIYATDPNEMVDLVTTITPFGTTSAFDGMYALDADFNPAFEARSGSGYGLDNIVQLGFVDQPMGFATAYESFVFKIKSSDLPGNTVVVKLEGGGGQYGDVVLTDTNVSTPLGNGWYQVVLPMADFTNVADAVGVLFERVGPQNADGGMPFSMLLTDIGFSGTAFVPADPGLIPDDVIYATDPNETVDLVTTITPFGTTSAFDGAYALDPDFNPAFEARSGSGYGLDNIVQLGFIDLPMGFATGYESFSFKIKSSDLPGNTVVVKLEGGGGEYGDVVLTDTNVSTP